MNLSKLNKSFSKNQIKFKQYSDGSKNTYYKEENKFYFSSILLKEDINKEWKCFILGKCMEMLSIPHSKIASYFNILSIN